MHEYILIRSHKRSLSLHIKEGSLVARAPVYMPRYEVEAFIKRKSQWITKHLSTPHTTYTTLFFLGKRYSHTPLESAFSFDDSGFSGTITKEHILAFYKKEFKRILDILLPEIANTYGFSYHKVHIKKLKSRWGSCSARHNLNFNYLLVAASTSVIRDVIIHELCHTIHNNHSTEFWRLVYSLSPNYEESKIWLKTHGTEVLRMLDYPRYHSL